MTTGGGPSDERLRGGAGRGSGEGAVQDEVEAVEEVRTGWAGLGGSAGAAAAAVLGLLVEGGELRDRERLGQGRAR